MSSKFSHFYPSHTFKAVFTLLKFATNQLLVIGNLKDFSSSTNSLEPVTLSHHYQSLLVVVEVHLEDPLFILVDDDFNLVDLFGWVKSVIISEVFFVSLAYLAITKS